MTKNRKIFRFRKKRIKNMCCPKCGTIFDKSIHFCSVCGTKHGMQAIK